MARRMGLGRGLDAFFNTETDTKSVSDQNKEKKADTEKKPASSGKKTAKSDKKPVEKESASQKKAEKGGDSERLDYLRSSNPDLDWSYHRQAD